MFACLNGGKYFSILDLREAYSQILLDEESQKLCVINMHRELLFAYNQLPFVIASALAIFQWQIETALQGLSGVHVYLDDISVRIGKK